MDFNEFLSWSRQSKLDAPSADRLCETRIAQAYSEMRPPIQIPTPLPKIHRCDLVRLWCEVRGIEASLRPRALACEGVRNALQLIFKVLAERDVTIALPSDVYPVYWQLAAQADVSSIAFETFPHFQLADILSTATASSATVVLLPQPLKLHGRVWTEEEVDVACDWLRRAPERRIILDAVYGFGSPLDSRMKRLTATDQVLVLDSLSKGWLQERVFGVVMVPRSDLAIYGPTFRSQPASDCNLFVAHELLTKHRHVPAQLMESMTKRRSELLARAMRERIQTIPAASGYLVAMQGSAPALLAEHSLLTIPATAFGSRLRNWSIASVLPASDTAP